MPQVAYESGNSVGVIKQHYLDLMTPSLAQAWFNVTGGAVSEYKKGLTKAAEVAQQTQSNEDNGD